MSLVDAVARARAYVRQAIETAPGFGRGHGPLNHAVTVKAGRALQSPRCADLQVRVMIMSGPQSRS